MLKTLLTTAILIYTPSAHAACIGFKNNMDALETAMAQYNDTTLKTRQSTPPTASINQSLTALEKAVKDHRTRQTTKTTPKIAY